MAEFSDFNSLKKDLQTRMSKAVEVLRGDFASLRTGRASVSLLDHIMVNVYGSMMPINQVGSVSAPEAKMLAISVWDKGTVGSVEKAIRDSDLGLNPAVDGTLIRLPIPALNEERRKEYVKIAHQYAEQSRVSIRNVRRSGMDALKKMEAEKHISEDDQKRHADEIQKETDTFVKEVDNALANKEKDIMSV